MIARLILRLIDRLSQAPLFLAFFLALFGAGAIMLLIIEQYRNSYLIVIGSIAFLITAITSQKFPKVHGPGSLTEKRVSDVIIVIFLVGWAIFNASYNSQNIFVFRDPGLYNVTAAWLIENDSLKINRPLEIDLNKNEESTLIDLGLIEGNSEEVISDHGLHLYPIILSIFGKLGGQHFIFLGNLLIGAMAIFSVYGFLRHLVRPKWALVASVALASTLPMIYFSRDTYTEPMAIFFVFSGLSAVWMSNMINTNFIWSVAGFIVAASFLIRADGVVPFLVSVFCILSFLLFSNKGEYKYNRTKACLFISSGFIALGVGILDLTSLSPNYYDFHREIILSQFYVLAIVITAFTILIPTIRRFYKKGNIVKLDNDTRKRLTRYATYSLTIIFALIATAPLWRVSREYDRRVDVNQYLIAIQQEEKIDVDETRDYSEQSIVWLSWYLGVPLLLMSAFGVIYVTRKVIYQNHKPIIVTFFILVIGNSLLFFYHVGITPDQIWAMRRFLPIIIPGIIIFAAIWVNALDIKSRSRKLRLAITVLAILFLIGVPLKGSTKFLTEQLYAPQLEFVQSFCNTINYDTAVIWVGSLAEYYAPTSRAYCNVYSVAIVNPTNSEIEILSSVLKDNGYMPLLATERNDIENLPSDHNLFTNEAINVEYTIIKPTISKPSSELITERKSILYKEL